MATASALPALYRGPFGVSITSSGQQVSVQSIDTCVRGYHSGAVETLVDTLRIVIECGSRRILEFRVDVLWPKKLEQFEMV
jgi:hypothetical protein